jgi:hypothetical protein
VVVATLKNDLGMEANKQIKREKEIEIDRLTKRRVQEREREEREREVDR